MSQTWRKHRTFVLEHHLWAAVLWRRSKLGPVEYQLSNREISNQLGHVHATVAQYALTGKSILTINRAMAIALMLGMERHEVAAEVTSLWGALVRTHKNLKVIPEFPSDPPASSERILRAYQIEDWMDGHQWQHIFREDVIEPDEMWRARASKGWSRWDAAKKFKVSEGTIVHWERVHVTPQRWDQARLVYGDLLQ